MEMRHLAVILVLVLALVAFDLKSFTGNIVLSNESITNDAQAAMDAQYNRISQTIEQEQQNIAVHRFVSMPGFTIALGLLSLILAVSTLVYRFHKKE